MASQYDRILAAGARLVGISVDSVNQNAAMVEKLRLPFPLLSDSGGDGAIKPYDVWHAEEKGGIARPAVVVVTPDGQEALRSVARDFADRLDDEELIEKIEALALDRVEPEPPTPGDPQPGPRAMPVHALAPYYRGARFAAKAISMRVPEATQEAQRLVTEVERYAEAARTLR